MGFEQFFFSFLFFFVFEKRGSGFEKMFAFLFYF